jgi:hypothetical protein
VQVFLLAGNVPAETWSGDGQAEQSMTSRMKLAPSGADGLASADSEKR